MIDFVERLPSEWEEEAQRLLKTAGRAFPGECRLILQVQCELTKLDFGPTQSKLERRFSELVSDPDLLPLQLVIEGLMRFLPSDRTTAREALILLANK
jgi:hypothetical protein